MSSRIRKRSKKYTDRTHEADIDYSEIHKGGKTSAVLHQKDEPLRAPTGRT